MLPHPCSFQRNIVGQERGWDKWKSQRMWTVLFGSCLVLVWFGCSVSLSVVEHSVIPNVSDKHGQPMTNLLTTVSGTCCSGLRQSESPKHSRQRKFDLYRPTLIVYWGGGGRRQQSLRCSKCLGSNPNVHCPPVDHLEQNFLTANCL